MKYIHSIAAITALLLSSATANAASTTATMGVTASVQRSCEIETIADLAFGNLSPTDGATNSANTTISVTCTSANPNELDAGLVALGFDGGSNADGTTRRMSDNGNTAFVPYSLSSGGNAIGVNGTVAPTSTSQGQSYSLAVDGEVISRPEFVVGDYTDTVTVTLTYSASFVNP